MSFAEVVLRKRQRPDYSGGLLQSEVGLQSCAEIFKLYVMLLLLLFLNLLEPGLSVTCTVSHNSNVTGECRGDVCVQFSHIDKSCSYVREHS